MKQAVFSTFHSPNFRSRTPLTRYTDAIDPPKFPNQTSQPRTKSQEAVEQDSKEGPKVVLLA